MIYEAEIMRQPWPLQPPKDFGTTPPGKLSLSLSYYVSVEMRGSLTPIRPAAAGLGDRRSLSRASEKKGKPGGLP